MYHCRNDDVEKNNCLYLQFDRLFLKTDLSKYESERE